MKNVKISSLQMMMLMYPTIIATAILSVPSIIAKYAKNDLWLPPIFASLIGFLTMFIIYKLHQFYPDKTIIEMVEDILGKIPGKIVGFIILAYFLQSTGEISRAYGQFITTSFMFNTPSIVIISLMVLLSAVAVYGGLEVLGRLGQLFFPVFLIPLIILFFLLIPSYEPKNVLPILGNGLLPSIKGSIIPTAWFGEIFLILFLLPYIKDKQNVFKFGMLTVFSAMLTLVLVCLMVLFVLGDTTATKIYPLLTAGRYFSYADFFENLDSVIMAIWIVGAFIKISMFYFAVVAGFSQLLNLTDYKILIWPIGILIVEFSFWAIPSSMVFNRYENTALPFYAGFVQTILPLLILGMAFIRKKVKKSLISNPSQ